jgi:hypothetical protein
MIVMLELIGGCSVGIEFLDDELSNFLIIDLFIVRVLVEFPKKQ